MNRLETLKMKCKDVTNRCTVSCAPVKYIQSSMHLLCTCYIYSPVTYIYIYMYTVTYIQNIGGIIKEFINFPFASKI